MFLFCFFSLNFFPRPFSRDEQKSRSEASKKKVTFDLSEDEDSEGEDLEEVLKTPSPEKAELKSSFEKRQEKVTRIYLSKGFILYIILGLLSKDVSFFVLIVL